MLGYVLSGTVAGIERVPVMVEADISDGLPQFDMVGFLASEVKEARERVRTAVKNTGFFLEPRRYTINLSPADLRKEGNLFDLPIAIAVLIGLGILPQNTVDDCMIFGELGLDGSIRPINGALPLVNAAAGNGISRCIVPRDNGLEASVVEDIDVFALSTLAEVTDYLLNPEKYTPVMTDAAKLLSDQQEEVGEDFSDINGQTAAKRATTIAAAGFHNILYIGPPGSGKSMMARRIPTILPQLTLSEAIELTKIYSICGLLPRQKALIGTRPFRSPHHTTSMQAMTGGGRVPRPGEISLADRGVLFLDELPEFNNSSLEVLRQPLEDRQIVLARVHGTYRYPADFQLVAAMNPCKCGYYPDRSKCSCTPADVARYVGRISRPLLDRIDLCVEMPRIEYSDLAGVSEKNETSAAIRQRVERAVNIQKERYKNEKILFNSQLSARLIEKYCPLGKAEREVLGQAFEAMNLSARAYHRIIKVARTIADLDGAERIGVKHITEAIGYRTYDREVWK